MILNDVHNLKTGDRVTWHDPDNNLCTKTFILGQVEIVGECLVLTDEDFSFDLECLPEEIEKIL